MEFKAMRDKTPLCVQVYDQVLETIEQSGFQPGDQLPGEVSLAQDLRVSRTVLREALLLLEEDGRVVRNRGKRWTIAAHRERAVGFADGFVEQVSGAIVPSRRLQARFISADAFTKKYFGTDEESLAWETVFTDSEGVVASSLEFLVASAVPVEQSSQEALSAAMNVAKSPPTLLNAVSSGWRSRLSPTLWRISAVSARTERLTWMDLGRDARPAVLTVGLGDSGRTCYLAKHIFDLVRLSPTIDLLLTAGIDHGESDERFVDFLSNGRS